MPIFASYPSLENRLVLVTGGASGIGAELVRQFALQGAKVGFIDLNTVAGQALEQQLKRNKHPPYFVSADVTDIDQLDGAIQEIRRMMGPICVLLNNAANDTRHEINELTSRTWDACLSVNLKHQFFAARNVAHDMKANGGGSIINFGSISWMLKQRGMPGYTVAKAAVHGLTRSLARELGAFNIRVNTLVPGWVMTERQLRLWMSEESREEIARGQCINRLLMPNDIARMALFLAADDSALCTGQDFVVDAGWS